MFTGIVETTGAVRERGRDRIVVEPRRALAGVRVGESVSVDGVCLTVERTAGTRLLFRLLPETVRASTLGELKVGARVNLERSLRAGDRLGGHLLLGHVDGRGTVAARRQSGSSVTLELQIPSSLSSLLVPKGPVAVDGVSLTLGTDCSSIHLVSHTLSATTLGQKRAGARVNLEVDPVAKYLWGML